MKKVELKLGYCDNKSKQKIMKSVIGLSGTESVSMSGEGSKLTITGYMDPVTLVAKVRKVCYAEILSVGPVPEKNKEEPKKEEPNEEDNKKEGSKKEEKKKDSELVTAYHPRSKALQKITYETSSSMKSIKNGACTSLNLVPGFSKLLPIGKVEVELINSIGFFNLDSMENVEVLIANSAIGSREKGPIQILYEEYIFSTYFPGREVPYWFRLKSVAPMISFTMRLSPHQYFRGLNLCLVYTLPADIDLSPVPFRVVISSKRSGAQVVYTPRCYGIPETGGDMVWLSHWFQRNLFKEGDEVQVRFEVNGDVQIKECGIHLLYFEELGEIHQYRTLISSWDSNASRFVPSAVQRSVFGSMMESILDSKSKLGPYRHGKREGSKCIVSADESELLYGTEDTTKGGRSLFDCENLQVSVEELVLLNEVRELVIRGLKLFPDDKEFLTGIIEKLPLSSEKGVFEEILLIAEELEQTPLDPRELEELNYDLTEVPPLFFHHFPILHVLDLSYTSVNSLPQSISKLIALKKLILRGCELLMELPAEIGELTNLEVLDLEGTEILSLPKEIVKLVNLTCLRVSFYGFAKQTRNLGMALSKLSRLNELIVGATPHDESWDVEVKVVIHVLRRLQDLRTVKLYLPVVEHLDDIRRNNPRLMFLALAKFRFTVGRSEEHFISRLPCDVEDEFNNMEKLEKGLKFVNGEGVPIEFTDVLKYAKAFFLQRHWTAKCLSEFGHENMNKLKFCFVMECNEFQTIFDYEQFYGGETHEEYSSSDSEDFGIFDEAILLESLEKLIIRYMKNLESICKGQVMNGCLSNLKFLALHTCPNLTTLFTIDMIGNLMNLEELIVEDCPKINNLVSLKSSDSKLGLFLPKLKKISLLELPVLVSISSGLCLAPKLERMVIFYCPKLEKLAAMEVSSTNLKVIRGEKEWWDALKWYESDLSTDHEDRLATLFVPLRRDEDLMTQLTGD